MKSKKEVSSGGVVYKKSKNSVQILLLKDPKSNWTFPKGLIEKDEDPILTALREIKEEVGVDKINYKGNLGTVHYMFTFRGTLVDKTVHYYLFEIYADDKLVPQKEEGIQEVKFVLLNQADSIIGYKKTNAPVLKKVKEFFQKKKIS